MNYSHPSPASGEKGKLIRDKLQCDLGSSRLGVPMPPGSANLSEDSPATARTHYFCLLGNRKNIIKYSSSALLSGLEQKIQRGMEALGPWLSPQIVPAPTSLL